MGRSRSRSHSADLGRWGDPETEPQERYRDSRRDRRDRSRSQDNDGRAAHRDRGRDRDSHRNRGKDRRDSRSRSRSHDRRGEARDDRRRDGHRDRDRDTARDKERDRDRDHDKDNDSRGQREDRDGGDRGQARGRGREDDRHRSRSRSRGREPDRGRHRWGSPRRPDESQQQQQGREAAAGGADGERRRRWRSPSPRQIREAGGDDVGRGGDWSNPPPPPFPAAAGRMPVSHAPAPPLSTAPPPLGSIHRGTVHTIRPFGIFVALPGYRRHVMVHNTQVSDELRFTRDDDEDAKVKALEFYFPKGEQVYVKITEVAPDERNPAEMRVSGSIRSVDQANGTDVDPEGLLAAGDQHGGPGGGRGRGGPETDEPPEVGSVHRAMVKRIEAYGVFVALEGFRRHGLVHTSQVSNYLSFTREDTDEQKKTELAGVVTVGEQLWVKVVEVAPDEARGGFKIGCSIKLANQASGEDLDPTNMRYRPRDAPGKGPGGPGGGIGAIAGEVGRGGKIDWGHLAGDTRLYVDEKAASQYKLIEDEPPPRPPLPGPPGRGAALPGLPQPGGGPVGRGRGTVLPAWMTQGSGPGAPGALAATGGGGGGSRGDVGGPHAPGSLPGPPGHPQRSDHYPGPQQQMAYNQMPAPNQLPSSSKFELIGGRDRDVDPNTLLLDLVGGGGGGGGGGAPRISSIEEALAILEAHGGGGSGRGSKKKKKEKKKKDKDKERKEKRRKSSKKSSGRKEERRESKRRTSSRRAEEEEGGARREERRGRSRGDSSGSDSGSSSSDSESEGAPRRR